MAMLVHHGQRDGILGTRRRRRTLQGSCHGPHIRHLAWHKVGKPVGRGGPDVMQEWLAAGIEPDESRLGNGIP